MRLDRNLNVDGGGKYALLKLRQMRTGMTPEILAAVKTLEAAGILDWGNTPETEFFTIRLKDKYANRTLCEYATEAEMDGEWEYGREVRDMASRSGRASPFCKKPD